MKKWFEKQWWMTPIGFLLTVLIGCFPSASAAIGTTANKFITHYWLVISIVIIILLLIAILKTLLDQQD